MSGTYMAMEKPPSRAALKMKPSPVTSYRSKNHVLAVPVTMNMIANGR